MRLFVAVLTEVYSYEQNISFICSLIQTFVDPMSIHRQLNLILKLLCIRNDSQTLQYLSCVSTNTKALLGNF